MKPPTLRNRLPSIAIAASLAVIPSTFSTPIESNANLLQTARISSPGPSGLNPGAVDLSFQPARRPNSPVMTIFVDSKDRLLFAVARWTQQLPLFRLNPDGSEDSQFQFTNMFGALGLQPDDQVLSVLKSGTDSRLVRLLSTGQIDPAFTAPPDLIIPDDAGLAAIQSDGKIVLAGLSRAYPPFV